jgi:glycosyltransferase involved in cell wall biosynthesis
MATADTLRHHLTDPSAQAANAPADPRAPVGRVLLWMPGGRRVLGGHVVQLEKTARALAEAGLDVVTEFTDTPPTTEVDLVHGFGLSTDHVRHWHRRGVPVVLSTIYWDRHYRHDGGPGRHVSTRDLASRVAQLARFTRGAMRSRAALTDACLHWTEADVRDLAVFESADLLLPNAIGEGDSIRSDFGVATPIVPIPNGVDPDRFNLPAGSFDQRAYVLYVGRIEPHKNQLGLIEALSGSSLPLVIAGHEHPDHARYVKKCRAAGSGWVTFHVSLDESALAELYRHARVHVLPSWFETTGLVSLEAALSGCSIVTTSRGYAREYFEDLAWYCDPGDNGSVLSAVRSAWATPPDPALRQRVLDRYTWRHVAETTMAAYDTLPPRMVPAR